MGIYDRDYYRNEGPGYLASITEHGKVCKSLIMLNVLIFVLQLLTRPSPQYSMDDVTDPLTAAHEYLKGGWVTRALELNVDAVLHGQVWRLLTYGFVHSELWMWHLVFNMLCLWWFGSDVEDLYGPREFLAVYLTSIVLGGLGYVLGCLLHLTSSDYPCVGASGGVMTMLVLCALHYPTRMVALCWFLPMPIWIFVLFVVAKDLYPLLSRMPTSTAVTVHLASAAFGYVYYKMQWRILNFLPSPRAWKRQRARAKLRIFRAEEEPQTPVLAVQATAPARDVDEQLEARMDAVLQKVSDHGMASLTEQEREILQRASERMKRKRK
jgi:membrane associated rhomboid family serine protease